MQIYLLSMMKLKRKTSNLISIKTSFIMSLARMLKYGYL